LLAVVITCLEKWEKRTANFPWSFSIQNGKYTVLSTEAPESSGQVAWSQKWLSRLMSLQTDENPDALATGEACVKEPARASRANILVFDIVIRQFTQLILHQCNNS
jgi:hypothetical protein